jgi:zinc protease
MARRKGEPVSAEELQKTINQVKAGFVYRDDSVTSQGSDLGYYGALGLYHYLDSYIKKIESVSPLEIQATAELYLDQDNRTVGWFIPRPARPGEAVPTAGRGGGLHYKAWPSEPAGKPWQQQAFPARPLALRTAAGVTPDSARLMGRRRRQGSSSRKTAPKTPPLSALLKELTPSDNRARPMPIRQVLPNGLVVIVFPNHSNPDISISGSVRTGAFYDPPDKAGLANFTASMLDRGTTTRTEEDLASQLDFVGASVDVSAGGGGTFFTAHCLDDDLSLTMGILADELRNPTFPPQSFDQMRNILATEIQEGDNDPTTVASRSLFGALYPPDYPLHWPPIGTTETLNHITRDDLQAFHDRYYRPDLTSLVIVGDVDPRAAIARVEDAFGDWATSGPPPSLDLPPPPPATAARRIVKTMPDKSEAVVAMGFAGISRKDHIYYPAYLMNLILGNDDFNSRFMKDIRDRKGLVYYVGSSWDAGALAGPWLLQMETSSANVDRAIESAILDIKAMQAHGPKPEEMKLFKGWVAGNQALQLETDAGIADMVEQSEYYGLGMDYLWHYPAIINSVTASQVWYAARKFLRPNDMITSIAGPYAERHGAVGAPATQPAPPLGTLPSTGPMGNPGDAGLHAQPDAGAGDASGQ